MRVSLASTFLLLGLLANSAALAQEESDRTSGVLLDVAEKPSAVQLPPGASAETPSRVEVSVGYTALVRGDALPLGIYASTALAITHWLALVGEAGWSRGGDTFEGDGRSTPFTSESEVTTWLAGGRVVPWSSGRRALFAEVLVGAYRDWNRVQEQGTELPGFPRFDVELDADALAFQLGGGALFWFNRRVGVQVLLHYRRTLGRAVDDYRLGDWHEARFGTGLTVGF